jgi:expansin (peptidoglycan-binding protein)
MYQHESRHLKLASLIVVALALSTFPAQGLGAGLKVQCYIQKATPTDNQIVSTINIVNESSAAVPLSTLTARYWYTADGTQSQVYWCDHAPFDCSEISSQFVTVSPAFPNVDTYLELGFTTAAGSLGVGQSTGDIRSRITKSDWGNYTETNDYSYTDNTSAADCSVITLYQDGVLIWGVEPTGESTAVSDIVPPSAPTDLNVTATTSTTVSLAWTASADDMGVTGYNIYNGTALALSVTTTSATVTDLSPATSYGFTVRATDAAGNLSAATPPLSASTLGADGADRTQAPYPPVSDPSACGSWALVDNVCCAQYCSDNDQSESCDSCGGPGSALCTTVDSKACMSGQYPEVHSVSENESWHYSRSTHFGLTSGGACGFGLYGLCTNELASGDSRLGAQCDAFCKAYPALCADPSGTTLRGNFAAPPGNYYTQFWPSLPGDRDNYLSCGECFEVVRTKKDGTDYAVGESGYTPPIVLQIVDSCPCSANSKWCCGSGLDHCGEVSDFKYGCPIPKDSIHLDLSDIAMARLQTGDANGTMVDGVIPIRYRRVPCPVVGNMYIWLRTGASPYYFALSVVNASGIGSIVSVEAQLSSGDWVALQRDPNYSSSRPHERYGAWVLPQGAGPFHLPVTLRITDPSGRSLVAEEVIKSWTPPTEAQVGAYYIDTGVQF